MLYLKKKKLQKKNDAENNEDVLDAKSPERKPKKLEPSYSNPIISLGQVEFANKEQPIHADTLFFLKLFLTFFSRWTKKTKDKAATIHALLHTVTKRARRLRENDDDSPSR